MNQADILLIVAATARRMNIQMTETEMEAAAREVAADIEAKGKERLATSLREKVEAERQG